MIDSPDPGGKVEQFDIVLNKMMTDETLMVEFGHVFNISTSKIVVAEYEKADWRVVMEQNPVLVILNQRRKDGEFPVYLEVTFIMGIPSKSSRIEAVDSICMKMNCKALISYPDNIPSHWILIHGNNTFQHVSIDPGGTVFSDNLRFTILAYGDFLDNTELDKLS